FFGAPGMLLTSSLGTTQTVALSSQTADPPAMSARDDSLAMTATREPLAMSATSDSLAASITQTPVPSPTRLAVARRNDTTVLSWDLSEPGSTAKVHVFRADYARRPDTGSVRVPWPAVAGYIPPGGFVEMPQDLVLPSSFTDIGTTDQPFFLDTTACED